MAPILGIMASSQQSGVIATGAYESIATVAVGSGGTSSINFNSIPTTYQHLQIRTFVRDGASNAGSTSFWIRFNSDGSGTGIYTYHILSGNGSSASVSNVTSWNQSPAGWSPFNSVTANVFGTSVIDILDYNSTNKTKVVKTLTGFDANGSGIVALQSGMRISTDAITSIQIYPGLGPFTQYSHFALYGIKGA